MTRAETARSLVVAGWAAGVALILAGWTPVPAIAILATVTALAAVWAWRGGALLTGTWHALRFVRLLRRLKTEGILDRP